MTARIRNGIDLTLEEEADAILRQSFLDQPDREAKALILTKWMLSSRRNREVYVLSGVPDGSVRRGSYHRALNSQHPHLNATEGHAQPMRRVPRGGDE